MIARGPRGQSPKAQGDESWERWQKVVIQLLVLVLKIISAGAIVAIFAIAEYAAVVKVAHALADQPVHATPQCSTLCDKPPAECKCLSRS
jgi:hypothetical protein